MRKLPAAVLPAAVAPFGQLRPFRATNPYDKHAVRVSVLGQQVDHLLREQAAIMHPQLSHLNRASWDAECDGRIVIAANGMYAICLHPQDFKNVADLLAARQRW